MADDTVDISGMPDPGTIGLDSAQQSDPTAGMPDPEDLYRKAHFGPLPNANGKLGPMEPIPKELVDDFMAHGVPKPFSRKGVSSLTGIPRAAVGAASMVPAAVAGAAGFGSGALDAVAALGTGDTDLAGKALERGRERGREWSSGLSDYAMNLVPATKAGAELSNQLMALPGEVGHAVNQDMVAPVVGDNASQLIGDVAQDVGTVLPALGAPGGVRAGVKGVKAVGRTAKNIYKSEAASVTPPEPPAADALKPPVGAPVTADTLRAQPNPIPPPEGTIAHDRAKPAAVAPVATPEPATAAPEAALPESDHAPQNMSLPPEQRALIREGVAARRAARGSVRLFTEPAKEGPQGQSETSPDERTGHLDALDKLSGGLLPSRRTSAITGDYDATGRDFQMKEVGSQPMVDQLKTENDALHKGAENVHQSLGSEFDNSVDQQTLEDRGRVTRNALQGIEQHFGKMTDEAYNAARAAHGTNPMPKFLDRASNFLGDEGNYMPDGFRRAAQARLNQLKTVGDNGNGTPNSNAAPGSVGAAEKFREWLNANRTMDNAHVIKQLKDHVDTDVSEQGGPGLFQQARNLRTHQAKMLEEPKLVSQLLTANDSQGINHQIPTNKVMDRIADAPTEQVDHLIKVLQAGAHMDPKLAESSAAAIREIQAHVVSRAHTAATNADGTWNARKFHNSVNSYSAKLPSIFKDRPDVVNNLQTLNKAGNTLAMDKHYPGAFGQEAKTGALGHVIETGGRFASGLAHDIPVVGRMVGRAMESSVEGLGGKISESTRDKAVAKRLVDRNSKQRGSVGVLPQRDAINHASSADEDGSTVHRYTVPNKGGSMNVTERPGLGVSQVQTSSVVHKGQGWGTRMLQRAADDAHARGQVLRSDAQVSHGQVGAYKNLAQLGYDVKLKPHDNVGGEYKAHGDHVFEVKPKQKGAQLNVGLNIGDPTNGGRVNNPREVVKAIHETGVKTTKGTVVQSNSEPTLVVDTHRPLTPAEGDRVAARTGQTAIAQHHGNGEGTMLGRGARSAEAKAQGWDKFNPDYFMDHDGKPLGQNIKGQRGSVQLFNDNPINRTNNERARERNERNPRTEYNANRQLAGNPKETAERAEILRRLSGQRGSVQIMRDSDDAGHYAEAKDENGKVIGHLHVPDEAIKSGHWNAGDMHVNLEHRRQGVASSMVDAMSKRLKLPFSGRPASVASPEGASFNAGYKGQRGAVRVMNEKPLNGAPEGDKPNGAARAVATAYAKSAGIDYKPLDEYRYVDPKVAKSVGDAYEEMTHDPTNPKVAKSYDAFKAETLAQYKQMVKAGVKVDLDPSYPYKNPREMHEDVRSNNHMSVYPTEEGFGTSGAPPTDHPLLEKSPVKIGGKDATYNDLFRAVHDYYGHAAEGNGFRANGEYNAWRAHRGMYSDDAKPAMDSETLGQNSWVNHGPPGALNKGASSADTIYADQKAGLLPSKVVKSAEEGVGADEHHITNQLTDSERDQLRTDTTKRFIDAFRGTPIAKEYAAAALAGAAKRGWYRNSAQAIVNQFGHDAPRFTGLLSAMSPQVSVQTNFANALKTYINWDKAGRPDDPGEIRSIMEDSSQKSATAAPGSTNVLDAWVNNAVRALTADDPTNIKLSGPKVHSFYNNLIDNVHEVTNDAWMAAFAKIDSTKLAGKLNGTGPGKSPSYLALSAKVREAASMISRLTGETWTPAEVQETVWSWAKTAYEHAEEKGSHVSIPDLVKNGDITDELIRSTPDFHQLFSTSEHRGLLQSSSFAGNADRMVKWQKQGADTARSSEARQAAEASLRPHLISAAERLEQVRQERRAAGRAAPKEVE